MKKLWLIVSASLLLSACGSLTSKSNSNNSNSSEKDASSSAKPKAGDTVVFKISNDSYGESKIDSIDGTRYKIPYGSTVNTVDETDVYPLPKPGAKSNVKVGDFVVAKLGTDLYWTPSEVLKVSDSAIDVDPLSGGSTSSLAPEKIISVHPAAVEEFKKLKAAKQFAAKAQSMRPTTVGTYVPKRGDVVVAAWGPSSWYTAKIISVSGDSAKIDWDVFSDSDLSIDKVAPFPRVGSTGAAVSVGSIVLVKPKYEKGTWDFAEVTSVNGQNIDIKLGDGETRSIRADEYIAMN